MPRLTPIALAIMAGAVVTGAVLVVLYVILSAPVHAVPDPPAALRHVRSLLVPDGRIYFTQTFEHSPSRAVETLKPRVVRQRRFVAAPFALDQSPGPALGVNLPTWNCIAVGFQRPRV